MPLPCYMNLEGQNQGKIEGSCAIKPHEKSIMVQAVDHTIEIPRSPQTGQPTGKRVHGAITITKKIDKSSPMLYQALTSGERFKTVKLEFPVINKEGVEETYYTIGLENAIITRIHAWVPNCLDSASKEYEHMEDVALTYEKITWSHLTDGTKEAEDSWLAPKAQ